MHRVGTTWAAERRRPARGGGAGLRARAGVRSGALALALGATLTGCALLKSCQRGDLEPANEQVARYHSQGMDALGRGEPQKAADSFELALKLQPLFVPSKAHLGYARFKLKQYDRALQELNDTVETHPDYADSYNYLGMVYEAKGDAKRAEELFGQALDTYPGYPDAHFNRAELYARQGRKEAALRDYETCATASAGAKDEHHRLLCARSNAAAGNIYVTNGLKQDAKQRFQIAIDVGVPIPEAHFGLGRLHALDELWVESILAFHEALREPDTAWVRKGEVDDCKKALAAAEKKAPDHIATKLCAHAVKEYDRLIDLSESNKEQYAKESPRMYDSSMRWLESAGRIDPKLIDVQILRARCYLDQGKINEAGRETQAALKIDAKNKDARFMLACIYVARAKERLAQRQQGSAEDWAKSEKVLRELRREDPGKLKYHNLLGIVYANQDEDFRAEREWREALQCEGSEAEKKRVADNLERLFKKPIFKKANEVNGEAVKALGAKDYDGARRKFKEAISYDDNFAVARANLGLTELEAGNVDLAMTIVKKALEIDPDLHHAHIIKGRIHRMQKDYPSAHKELDEARRLNTFDVEVHYQTALLLHEERKPAEAEKACQRAIALQPNHFPTDVLIARMAREKNQLEKAETHLLRAAANSENNYAPCFFALGDLYIAMRKYEDARSAAERAYQLDPQSAEPWMVLGQAYEAEGKAGEAVNSYVTAATAFDLQGRLDDSLKAAERAAKLAPRSPAALDVLGMAKAKSGKLEEGVRHLRQALVEQPTYLKARFNLGTIYEEMKERELAAEAYRECVKAIQQVSDPENAEQVRAYVLPRYRLASLYQPGVAGPVDRSEAIRVLHEAERVATPDLKPVIRQRLIEVEQ